MSKDEVLVKAEFLEKRALCIALNVNFDTLRDTYSQDLLSEASILFTVAQGLRAQASTMIEEKK